MSNSDEWFDVVDENDRPLTTALRETVHAQGLRHRAIHVWLFHPDGRLLLQKRSALKDCHPLVWDSSASGHVDAGESYDDSARRETIEELGLDPPPPLALLGKVPASRFTEQEFVCLYTTRHAGPFRFPVEEIEALEWMRPSDLTDAIARHPGQFAPCFRYLWATFHRQVLTG